MIRSRTSKQKEQLIDKLSELEHEQWMEWSKSIAPEIAELRDAVCIPLTTSDLGLKTTKRLERWNGFWVSYDELNEKTKERDRVWARKVLQIFKERNMEILSR